MALQRAEAEGIPAYHLSANKSGNEEALATEILDILAKYNVEMIFLAGYMRNVAYIGTGKNIIIESLIYILHYYLNLVVRVCME